MENTPSPSKHQSSMLDPAHIHHPKHRYSSEIQSMLFTFGDVRNPLPESVSLVEDLVLREIRTIIYRAAETAAARNIRNFSTDDIVFALRHHESLIIKLRDFLAWKDVRKNVKGSNDNEPSNNTVYALSEELNRPLRFSWEPSYFALDSVPHALLHYYEDFPVSPITVKLDKLDRTCADNPVEKELQFFDQATRNMTTAEYLEYSECRQASFTLKRAKKFREWTLLGQITDYRLNDDCIELLGFIAWEYVQELTTTGLRLQSEHNRRTSIPSHSTTGTASKLSQKNIGPFALKRESKENGSAQDPLLPNYLLRAHQHYLKSTLGKVNFFNKFFL
jgi:transcription initiation protein SPT3